MITRNLFQKMGMLAVMGIAAASCSQDELTGNRGLNGNAVKFGIVASSTPAEDTPETRALNADDTPVMLLAPGGQDTLYLHPWVTENHSAPSTQEEKGMTRGVPVDSETDFENVCQSFHVTAYTDDGKLFMDNEEISKAFNNVWSPDVTYFWPAKGKLDFYAYAAASNVPTINITQEKNIKFNYTVPDPATSQPDIMFAHTTRSKETGGPVELNFNHALAAVKFVAKDVTNCTVESITLKDLYGEGSCTYTYDTETETATFAWTREGDKKDFSQEFEVNLTDNDGKEPPQPITDKNEATTFMLIPQPLKDIKVEVVVKTDEGTSTLTGSLTGEWLPGHIYTYAISTESINWEYVFAVTPVTPTPEQGITLALGETQAQYTVTSYRYRKGNPDVKEAVAWSAVNTSFSETVPEEETTVNVTLDEILSKFTYAEDAPTGESTDYDIILTETTLHTTHPGDKALKNATQKGSPENPYDLSTHDENGGNIPQTTANCYVVSAAGTYQLPLVYGNAIKNGNENKAAYQGGNFKDYQNHTISNSSIIDADDAVLVWSDGFFMFKDIHLDAAKENLVFTIDPDYMQQANAVLAVRDANDNIMWSWHIWVTEHKVLDKTYTVHGYGSDNTHYNLMQYNLGWVDGKSVYYNQRNLTFKFVQAGSGETDELNVTQEGAKFDYKDVGSTYYQWGRKDPLVALKNWDLIGANEYRPHQVGKEDYSYRTEAKRVSIGESIQHPNVYYVRSGTGNWNSNPVETLWNNQSNGGTIEDVSSTKTIYDPSPRGFQVPVPKAFAVFVNGCSESPGGTKPNVGTLNGISNVGEHKNQYKVYTQSNSGGEMITLTGTGQRADLDKKLPAYTEGNTDAELGGLWAMYGVYFMTCVPVNPDQGQAYTLAIRRDVDAPEKCTVYTYGFVGNMTMARPVRPIKETN